MSSSWQESWVTSPFGSPCLAAVWLPPCRPPPGESFNSSPPQSTAEPHVVLTRHFDSDRYMWCQAMVPSGAERWGSWLSTPAPLTEPMLAFP